MLLVHPDGSPFQNVSICDDNAAQLTALESLGTRFIENMVDINRKKVIILKRVHKGTTSSIGSRARGTWDEKEEKKGKDDSGRRRRRSNEDFVRPDTTM